MRITVGKWLIGAGIGIAGLGSVAVALQAPMLGWLVFAGGIILALVGAVYMLLGDTKDERRARQHERTVERNRLENERDELTARRAQIDADLDIRGYWHGVAADYGDNLRTGAIGAEVATLTAERDGIDRRLSQIEAELATA